MRIGLSHLNAFPRQWDAKSSYTPLKGVEAVRKPDISSFFPGSQTLDWRHLISFCEVKNRCTPVNERKSYVEAAGKASCLLYAQDGRHLAPCIRILGSSIYLTIFDRGGSLSTAGFDIHSHPEVFLRILIGVSAAPLSTLGFDASIKWRTIFRDGRRHNIKQVDIERNGCPPCTIELTKVLFISDNLHGRGTTVWEGELLKPVSTDKDKATRVPKKSKQSETVAMKDSWINPLRTYTEGMILAILNEKRVEGVPILIHEQQVKAVHPSSRANETIMANGSTHTIRSAVKAYSYYLRILSRIVTKPVGAMITDFSCLGELLVAFLDYIVGEHFLFSRL